MSLTEISTESSARLALIPIRPPSGVNFTALESTLAEVILKGAKLERRLRRAIGHAHDAEEPDA